MLTQALMIGMTPYEFWHETPSLFYNYLDAYECKKQWEQESEFNKMNFNAWLNGLYILKARIASPPLGKGSAYPDKPIEFNTNEQKKVDNMTEEERRNYEIEIAKAQFEAFGKYANAYNKQYFGGEEGE